MDRRLLLPIQQGAGGTTVSSLKVTGAAPHPTAGKTLYNDSIVKLWCSKNGQGTPTIDDDLNVNSITDVGVGLWTFNAATALGNATYAVSGVRLEDAKASRQWGTEIGGRATTSVAMGGRSDTTDAAVDDNDWAVVLVGDD